jgi:hypothetical protein
VEGAVERDHGGSLRVRLGELDGVLHRLGARVEEPCANLAGDRRDLGQALRERDVVLVRDDREVRVREERGLLLRGLDDARVRVPDGEAADAACEVDERVAVEVGEEGAAALRDDEREVDRERRRDDALLPVEHRAACRARDVGLQLDGCGGRHARELTRVGRAEERP